jgi:hypothetical protein
MVAGWRGTLDTLLIFVRIDALMVQNNCNTDDTLGWSLLRRRSDFRNSDGPEPPTRL